MKTVLFSALFAIAGLPSLGQAAPAYSMTEIPLPDASANAINDRGEVVGIYWDSSAGYTTRRAFVFRSGTVTPLVIPASTSSSAQAINARGEITGSVGFTNSEGDHGFLWQGGRVATFLHPNSVASLP